VKEKKVSNLGELADREVHFAEGECRFWRLGRCRFWVERRAGEWRVAFAEPAASGRSRESGALDEIEAGVSAAPPSELSWLRFITGSGEEIIVRPALPDRPVIVRPRSPVAILPGRSARFFVRIPAWVSIIAAHGERREILIQRPVVRLSNTWFGEPDSGELCYSFASPLAATPAEAESTPFTVVCPIAIRNEAAGPLDFQRLCVRVQYLSLYAGKESLATNELDFHYRGADQSSPITFQEEPPDFERDVRRISGPQVSPSKNLIQKSFEYFKSLTTY